MPIPQPVQIVVRDLVYFALRFSRQAKLSPVFRTSLGSSGGSDLKGVLPKAI